MCVGPPTVPSQLDADIRPLQCFRYLGAAYHALSNGYVMRLSSSITLWVLKCVRISRSLSGSMKSGVNLAEVVDKDDFCLPTSA